MKCPVCQTPDVSEYSTGAAGAQRFDCKRCGEFDVSGTVVAVWLGTSLLSESPHNGAEWVLDHLRQTGVLSYIANGAAENRSYTVQLTMHGWEKYAALKRMQVNSRTAFMAMKFGDTVLDKV